ASFEQPELDVFAAYIFEPGQRIHKAAPAVQEPRFQNIAAKESPPWIKDNGRKRGAAALSVLMLGHHRRITFLLAHLLGEGTVGVVFQITFQHPDFAVDADRLVDFTLAAPAAATAIEQPEHAVGIGVAVTQEAAEVFRQPREAV